MMRFELHDSYRYLVAGVIIAIHLTTHIKCGKME